MTNNTRSIFRFIYELHPENVYEEIGKYINEYVRTYQRFTKTVVMEIMVIFRQNGNDPEFTDRFPEIYDAYASLEFSDKLSEQEKQTISNRYIEELWNYREEFMNDIQKETT